jgi:hypothetical protein
MAASREANVEVTVLKNYFVYLFSVVCKMGLSHGVAYMHILHLMYIDQINPSIDLFTLSLTLYLP